MVQKQRARAVRPGTLAIWLAAAGMALALAGLVVARRVVPTLSARYDREALRVAPPVEPGPTLPGGRPGLRSVRPGVVCKPGVLKARATGIARSGDRAPCRAWTRASPWPC